MDATRRGADFLALVRQRERGKLKVYIGSAAGTGKTYRMLNEARDLRCRRVDVVIGFVETHGRVETTAKIGDLETVPRKEIAYRNVTLEEMNIDVVIARRPQVAIVDELAHTNVPGARNGTRWQDVMLLLDEGINVISAVNVQHLESLNGVLERELGVTIRETVPGCRPSRPSREPRHLGRTSRPKIFGSGFATERSIERTRSKRRSPTFSPTRTSRRCASWRFAKWPTRSIGRAKRLCVAPRMAVRPRGRPSIG
ncbi:MAG TPA: hypothetical protein VHV78_03735 [Gemmatimonadaceae bacterium]|jgi:hypothetical protein|nr:hypothetical protein [Gemmatimonadaceae bacterium]